MNATATATQSFQAGDVVWGRPVREGKPGARRKGIVLGTFDQRTDESADRTNLVVWWYGLGAASMDTTTLAFARELAKAGDIFDFGASQAAKLVKMVGHFERARSIGWSLVRHAARMKQLGAQFPAA